MCEGWWGLYNRFGASFGLGREKFDSEKSLFCNGEEMEW